MRTNRTGSIIWRLLPALWPILAGAARFEDHTAAMGLTLPAKGGGACWVDYDRDGWVDLVAGGILWRNDEGKRFVEVTRIGSVVAADFDNDGWVDFYSWSARRLYRNDAGQGLIEVELPAFPEGYASLGAAWGDFTGDGWVDLYVGGYENWNKGITHPDLLLVNRGGHSFEITWRDDRSRARGVTACDFNRDGRLDVYVSNYRLQPNRLWRNSGGGILEDVAAAHNAVATSEGFAGGHSIGAAWGDFDNDGDFDLFAGNFAHVDQRGDQPKSRFLRNRGPAHGYRFEDRGPCGIPYQESYASPAAADYDNDGWLDLYFTTVYAPASFGRMNYPVLFRNDSALHFNDVNAAVGLAELPPTYQAAWADVNNNGHLDLLTAGRLFLNPGTTNHWIKIRLEGDGRLVNRAAIGAQARIRIGDQIITRQVEAGTGQGNQNDLNLHFGLGQAAEPVALEILWPGGYRQTITGLTTDKQHVIHFERPTEGAAHPEDAP
ncbi:MAG: CRTAC1 family protein [Candidatus Marinimicrobia bacterium]|nr:CRTAC1 family protein [Candidatus Neomarinimicrobiota bacterium]